MFCRGQAETIPKRSSPRRWVGSKIGPTKGSLPGLNYVRMIVLLLDNDVGMARNLLPVSRLMVMTTSEAGLACAATLGLNERSTSKTRKIGLVITIIEFTNDAQRPGAANTSNLRLNQSTCETHSPTSISICSRYDGLCLRRFLT